MAFISETHEFFAGNFRNATTIAAKEVVRLIEDFRKYLPGVVKKVIIQSSARGEFVSLDALKAAIASGFSFVIANCASKPGFAGYCWYKMKPKDSISHNDCTYQPQNWDKPYRFVAVRIPIEEAETVSESEKQQVPLCFESSSNSPSRAFISVRPTGRGGTADLVEAEFR